MSADVPANLPPIPATTPVEIPAQPKKVFDRIFPDEIRVTWQGGQVYDIESFWRFASADEVLPLTEPNSRKNSLIRDILSPTTAAAYPEIPIKTIAAQLLGALQAAAKKNGDL